MLKGLVLVRHGDAETRRLGESDAQRRLTPWGLKALEKAYPEFFAPLRDYVDDVVIWSSGAVRAMQTAQVVADALGIDRSAIEEHASLYAQDDDYFYGELYAADGIVVAVGHIPFMEDVASYLAQKPISFYKGSVAFFDCPDGKLNKAKLVKFDRGPKV